MIWIGQQAVAANIGLIAEVSLFGAGAWCVWYVLNTAVIAVRTWWRMRKAVRR